MNSAADNTLEAIGISKRFGSLQALNSVSMRIQSGTFHALLGENGAGKSTLVKCIMGYYLPDQGQITLGGREQSMLNPQHAMKLGIGMVYQHFTLIPNMTVLENLVLSRPDIPAFINWNKERDALKIKLQGLPFRIDLDAPVNRLAAGEKQKIEILKQLIRDVRVLILDEPTSVLTPTEADEVLGQIQQMTRQNGISVLIITHKFREVMRFADDVTVLRKGATMGSVKVKDSTPISLANMMVGREIVSEPLTRKHNAAKSVVLNVESLDVPDENNVLAVNNFSLQVSAGEIVGVAGVSGNGQRELVQALSGQRRATRGSMRVNNEIFRGQRAEIRRLKVRCLPEEPLRSACVSAMTVAENMSFRRFDRPPYAHLSLWLNRKVMRDSAREWIGRFNVRPPAPNTPIGKLSGGNVQRAVLARELSDEVDLLIVANPCFGLDFAAVAFMREKIMALRNGGAAVLLISEDLDEILEMSDRLVVMSGGKNVYETTPREANLSVIGQFMAGH